MKTVFETHETTKHCRERAFPPSVIKKKTEAKEGMRGRKHTVRGRLERPHLLRRKWLGT